MARLGFRWQRCQRDRVAVASCATTSSTHLPILPRRPVTRFDIDYAELVSSGPALRGDTANALRAWDAGPNRPHFGDDMRQLVTIGWDIRPGGQRGSICPTSFFAPAGYRLRLVGCMRSH